MSTTDSKNKRTTRTFQFERGELVSTVGEPLTTRQWNQVIAHAKALRDMQISSRRELKKSLTK